MSRIKKKTSQNWQTQVFGLPRTTKEKRPRPRNIINLRIAWNKKEILNTHWKEKKSYRKRMGITVVWDFLIAILNTGQYLPNSEENDST